MTQSVIKPATFRFVEERLNQLRYRVPPVGLIVKDKKSIKM
jgi:hypothetical protein